jgi:hypothetical protein
MNVPRRICLKRFRRGIFFIMTNINQAINQQDVFLQAIHNYVPYPG